MERAFLRRLICAPFLPQARSVVLFVANIRYLLPWKMLARRVTTNCQLVGSAASARKKNDTLIITACTVTNAGRL